MSRMDLISFLLRIDRYKLSRVEKNLLENKLFILVYCELCEIFKLKYTDFFKLIPFDHQKENDMWAFNIVQEIIKDILSTKEYSLSGIATHTNIPEEVLSDVVSGINTNPTLELSRKLFELHMLVRRDLYDKIIEKILRYLQQKTNSDAKTNDET